MESRNVSSRDRIQTFEEDPAQDSKPESTKSKTIAVEVFDSLQLLVVAIYPAVVWLTSVPDPC